MKRDPAIEGAKGMIHADEIQLTAGESQVVLTIVETATTIPSSMIATAQHPESRSPGELILSGSEVLAVLVSALSSVVLFLWAVIRLWLFES